MNVEVTRASISNAEYESVLTVADSGLALYSFRKVGTEANSRQVMVRAINGNKLHKASHGGSAYCNSRMKISLGLPVTTIAKLSGVTVCDKCFGDEGRFWIELANEAANGGSAK